MGDAIIYHSLCRNGFSGGNEMGHFCGAIDNDFDSIVSLGYGYIGEGYRVLRSSQHGKG